MPLQNRADPFGALHATEARGTVMGNRGGRFHRADKSLQKRHYVSRRWICCVCDFRGRHRQVWGDSYTEIFFLDEVTALAGGHRPCYECRRQDAKSYAASLPLIEGATPSADPIDRVLHDERRAIANGSFVRSAANSLPNGAMFAIDGKSFAVRNKMQLVWNFSGYTYAGPVTETRVDVLTPSLSLHALRHGFSPRWHDSARLQGRHYS